jgi:putative ABC transport system permease protein
MGNSFNMATVPQALATELEKSVPGAQYITNFHRLNGEVLNDGKAIELSAYFASPSLFDLFTYPLKLGNAATALVEPYSIVLKAEVAEKFFKDEDPIGQTMKVGNKGTYTVTGVFAELPGKTHIRFDAMASISSIDALDELGIALTGKGDWYNGSQTWTYFQLQPGTSVGQVEAALDDIVEEFYTADKWTPVFSLQAMADITPGPLFGNPIGDGMPMFFVIGLGVLATLIMICAAFNYTNLSAARAITRTKEVGVRKVMGARRSQLTFQFIIESILLSLLSLVLAVVFLQFLVPAFEGLQMSTLLNWELKLDAKAYVQFVGFALLLGLFTGLFPSLYLSSFNAINAMKGALNKKRLSGWALRKSLIVIQFVISIVLISSSLLVYKQIKFIVDKDYGYTKENIINIDLQGQDYAMLKTELEKLSFIQEITGASVIPNTGITNSTSIYRNTPDEDKSINYFYVDENYIDVLDLELIAGENFQKNASSLNEQSILLNEKALSFFGFESTVDALGQQLYLGNDARAKTIIGIVKDFNYQMLLMDIHPLMFQYDPKGFNFAQVKISGFDLTDEMIAIDKVWDAFDPNHELVAKTFQGQQDEFNAFFYDILYIVALIAVLSITIAGMGLLGISAFAIQARMKEVSIRKVLGAEVKSIVMMLSKSFIIMLSIALILGFTIAYFGNGIWLNMFAYRTSFGIDIFLSTALGLLLVAIGTIGWQAMRATNANPATTLRDD